MSVALSDSPTVHLVSLGCPKNRVDAELMLGSLVEKGYRIVPDAADAEVILVNSCAFIGPAKEESIAAILEAAAYKEKGRCRSLVVSGCLAQRYADQLLVEMPEVDHFIGTSGYPRIAEIIRSERDRAVVPDPDYVHSARTPRLNSMPRWTAYVKISEGCDNKCAFCIIPTLRGKQRSRPIADVVEEAHKLVADGAVELNLVAQDLTAYGYDQPGRPRLHDLLAAMRDVRARWIRLHYAYPRDVPDALVDVMASQDNIAKYIDMPFQHATDRMLRLMRRGRDRAFLDRLVRKMRSTVPGLVFRTSFIVGFPGETEEDFQSLCDFVREHRFDRVGVFEFSREEGTPSFDMEGQVPSRTKARRRRELMALQREISREHQAALVGRTLDVLVEGVSDETDLLLEGRYYGQAPEIDGKVYLNRGTASPGSMVRALVEDAGEYDLVAGIEGAADAPVVDLASRAVMESTSEKRRATAPVPLRSLPILSH
jgi:ribosomal protein S12 methylthiotransferase